MNDTPKMLVLRRVKFCAKFVLQVVPLESGVLNISFHGGGKGGVLVVMSGCVDALPC